MKLQTTAVACPVCGDAAPDEESRVHALAARLFGMDAEALIGEGVCPRCGSVGCEPDVLRADWDAWAASGDADEDDADALDELGFGDG